MGAVEKAKLGVMETDEIKNLLLRNRLEREQRAMSRIKEILAEERCTLNPVVILTDKGITSRVEIAAQD